jgi:hypothetical protein
MRVLLAIVLAFVTLMANAPLSVLAQPRGMDRLSVGARTESGAGAAPVGGNTVNAAHVSTSLTTFEWVVLILVSVAIVILVVWAIWLLYSDRRRKHGK